jgi:hypothetical protein
MTEPLPTRAHLIAGGFPAGSYAGHDHDYARLRLLGLLATISPMSRSGCRSAIC